MNRNDLRIATWNANGVRARKEEVELFLNNHKIDICLISETHSTRQTALKFRGYRVYQTIHPDNDAKGGSAVIIREHISHYEELSISSVEFQVTVIGVNAVRQKFLVGALYCPPRHNLKRNDYMEVLKQLGERFILGGDFNAKHEYWGSRLTTTKGRELKAAIDQIGCKVFSTGKPTYWPTDLQKVPDLLDFFICKKIATNFMKVEEVLDLNSDHSAVILTISETAIQKEVRPVLVNRTTDWDSFRKDLDSELNLSVPLKTSAELDIAVEKYVSIIQTAAWNNTKVINRKTVGINYPVEVRNLVREKRRLRRKWQQSRDPTDKTSLNNETQQLKREIQKLKEESMSAYLSKLSACEETNYSLWKATKKMKNAITAIPPIRNHDGKWIREDKLKAEAFADHLANTFRPHDGLNTQLPKLKNQSKENIDLVTPAEVAKEIRTNLNPRKAPGYDLITGEVLKHLSRKGIVMLTYICNAAFRLKHVPDCWKVAEVIMLPKPGKPTNDIKSYRPIYHFYQSCQNYSKNCC